MGRQRNGVEHVLDQEKAELRRQNEVLRAENMILRKDRDAWKAATQRAYSFSARHPANLPKVPEEAISDRKSHSDE